MLDPAPFHAGAEVVADLALVGLSQSVTQEGRHLLALHRVDRRPRERP